jgi:prepilin-type N-terminal cleavage/methylation domain-containing protein
MANKIINNDKGFTLVEVIVVAVIVAVLAAVAIPMYIGYVNDSAQNMVNNEAAGLSAAVSSAINYQFTGAGNITVTAPTSTAAGSIVWAKGGFPTALTQDISYKMQAGVVPDANFTAAKFLTSGTTCMLTFKTKNATASW